MVDPCQWVSFQRGHPLKEETTSREAIITSEGKEVSDLIDTGRRFERMVLMARERKVAVHPMTQYIEEKTGQSKQSRVVRFFECPVRRGGIPSFRELRNVRPFMESESGRHPSTVDENHLTGEVV